MSLLLARTQLRFTQSVAAAAAGRGLSLVDYKENLFVATLDPTMYIGYNQDANGNVIKAGEPGLSWCIEGDYDDGSGQNKMEAYVQYRKADNSGNVRPLFIQMNRVTNLCSALVLSSPLVRLVTATGASTIDVADNTLTFNSVLVQDTILRINADATKNAKLGLGSLGAADVVVLQPDNATQGHISVGAAIPIRFYSVNAGGNGSVAIGGVNDNAATLTVDNAGGFANQTVIVARGKAAQSVDILQVQANGGAVLASVRQDGLISGTVKGVATVSKAGTPVDGDWTTAPPIGTMVVDTTASKIWVRTAAATWKGVVVA